MQISLRQVLIFFLLLSCSSSAIYAGPWTESGILPVANFTTDDYEAAPQNWCGVQGHDDLMYFGNHHGVLVYDGNNWLEIQLTEESAVKSLYTADDGTVFVGGVGEFGRLRTDSIGNLRFEGLSHLLDSNDANFGAVWSIVEQDGRIIFLTTNYIFLFDGQHFESVQSTTTFRTIFSVAGRVYTQQRDQGLKELVGTSVIELKFGDEFIDKPIYGLVENERVPGQLIVATRSSGIYTLSPDGVHYIPSIVKEISEDYPVFNLHALGNGLFSVGTLGAGIIIIDDIGAVRRMLDKDGGIQNSVVYSQCTDNQNNLWLMLSNGISRLEHASPLSYFNEVNGLEGTVEGICRHDGRLFAATITGVYELSAPFGYNQASMWLMTNGASGASFENTNHLNKECWDIESIVTPKGNQLLASTNDGIYHLKRGKTELIYKCLPWLMTQSKVDPNRLYIGLEQGVASLYFNGRKWEEEGVFSQVSELIRNVTEESERSLWLNTDLNGIIHVEFENSEKTGLTDTIISIYDEEHGLPSGPAQALMTDNGIVFGTYQGLYEFVPERHQFVRYDPPMAEFHIHRMSQDVLGNIWVSRIREVEDNLESGLVYITPYHDEQQLVTSTPFMEVSSSIIHAIHHDQDGTAWLGGPGGIYRYDPMIVKDYDQAYPVMIRSVKAGRDSTLFSGAGLPNVGVLDYALNTMTFRFSAPFFKEEAGTRFRYQLQGFDDDWTDWSFLNQAHYTNLPEGNYTFKVRAKNIFAVEGTQATFTFTIAPPYYRTWWAYLTYLIGAGAFVWGAVSFSTRRLKEIIRHHTAEIVEQKEVIEEKNKDITDSINYAKKIQDSFLPSESGWHQLLPNSFALLTPKDIVSGDFKWVAKSGEYVFFTAADCTGHGVPGAFMSMVGTTFLNQVVKNQGQTQPGEILNRVRDGIIQALRGNAESEQKDGMDLALCGVDLKTGTMRYAGANNPLWLIRSGDEPLTKTDGTILEPVLDEGNGYRLYEVKGDKQPVGYYPDAKPFTTHEIIMNKGTDTYYVFSDGYADQFGGKAGKKFKTRAFKKLLLSIQDVTIGKQGQLLHETIEAWRGEHEQVDDICVVGLRY